MVKIYYVYDMDLHKDRKIYHNIPVIKVKDLEKYLDNLNYEKGNKDRLCLFCGSNEYNSKVGIIHKDNCIIIRLREVLKNGRKNKRSN